MKQGGNGALQHLSGLLLAFTNPWGTPGILFLLVFFSFFITALSRADLPYLLPASSLGYVLLALIARFALHEHVSVTRWMGIALVSSGVGFVTRGPELTRHSAKPGVSAVTAGQSQ